MFTSSRKSVTALFLERTGREIGNRIKPCRAQLTSRTKVENAKADLTDISCFSLDGFSAIFFFFK